MLQEWKLKTKSEFPDGYLDFVQENGVPSALWHDCDGQQIHCDLVIADQWIEPHIPFSNPTELNGAKYLKTHAHVLLDVFLDVLLDVLLDVFLDVLLDVLPDTAGPPDFMWFLAQDYLAHVYNLSAYRHINWQMPWQVSRTFKEPKGWHQIFPYPYVLLLWTCSVFRPCC